MPLEGTKMKQLTFGLAAMIMAAALLANGCKPSAPASAKLHLFVWSEYVPAEVLSGFTRETGIETDSQYYDQNERMVAKLSATSPEFDIIQPSEYIVEQLAKRQMLAPLDLSQIPNAANLLPQFRDLPFDPGNKYSIPYMSGVVGIIINTEKVKEPVAGFKDVFQPKYTSRIIVIDDNREMVSWAFATLGISINDVSAANLEKARPLLKQWISMVKFDIGGEPRTPLMRGEADLGIIYSGDAAKLIETDKKFKFVIPSEGSHRFVDHLCIPVGSKNREAAMKFINYVLRPEVSKIISEKFPYTNPNAAARKLLTADQLANPASYPAGADKMEVFRDIGKASIEVTKLMTELRGS